MQHKNSALLQEFIDTKTPKTGIISSKEITTIVEGMEEYEVLHFSKGDLLPKKYRYISYSELESNCLLILGEESGLVYKTGFFTQVKQREYCLITLEQIRVNYVGSISDEKVCYYFQHTLFFQGSSKIWQELRLRIIEEFGLENIEVKLPEKVVTLPLPEFIDIVGDVDGMSTFEVIQCFKSEARAIADTYITQLNQVVDG